MNGFDITLLAPHAFLVPIGIDFTGTLIGTPAIPPIVLAECLQGVLVAGSVCQSSDTIDTLHLAAVAAPNGIPGGTTAPGASGILFTAMYQIVGSAPAGTVIGFQSDTNDGLTNCANLSVLPNTCINISNGTKVPVPETAQTGTFTSAATQPSLQLSPSSTVLGNAFPGNSPVAQTVTATDTNGWAAWMNNGGPPFNGDTTITFSVSVAPPTSTATGVTATISTTPIDFCPAGSCVASVTNSLTVTNAGTSTAGLWTITVAGTYHFDPNCAAFVSCPGPASTLFETLTYTLNIEDFNYNVGGVASGAMPLPFWCSPVSGGVTGNCPAGQSGSTTITVSPNGYTGAVALTNSVPSPPTTPALTGSFSVTSVPGASGTSIDTFTGGLLRPLPTTGQYVVTITGTGTLAANGVFATAQNRAKPVTAIVRPENFNLTTSNGTPTGPSLSFASGSSAIDTLTIGSLPSGSVAINAAGFAGPVTLSSTITGGTGLVVTPTTSPVTLTAGQKLTDLVTFSGTVTITTTFSVTITGTATLATSTPSAQTHSVTYSITITAVVTAHPTSTTVSCTTPVVINQGSTCNVSVTDTSTTGAITPTGTVNLSETGVTGSFTTCTLAGTIATATCTSTFTASTSGTAAVTASYPGVTNQFLASSGTTSIVVNPRATTTTVTCTTPVSTNQGSTCSITISDTSPGTFITPTGTVGLSQTGVTGTFTTCTLAGTTASATCTSTFTASTTGTAAVTASYPGDTAHLSSSGTTSVTVTPPPAHPTTTSVSCTSPVVVNQGSTCTVTVMDTSATGATTPTGTVALSETGVTGSFTTCTLAGTTATATCTSSFIATTSGTASVTASYPGDTTHSASSGTTSVMVNARATTTTVSCSTPVVINQGSTCTVTVIDTSTGTGITPTGTVALTETGVTGSFTTCILAGTTASATCTSTFTATTSGTAAVTASYPGDSPHASSSGTASLVVSPRATTTTVVCTSQVLVNQGATCNVTVTDTSAGTPITPTGTVALSETGVTGTFTLCTLGGTTASATCTSTFTASTSGPASVTANYPGDTTHASSSGASSTVIVTRLTTTTVTCSPTSVSPSQTTTCTATVNDPLTNPGTQLTPTGTVAFTSTGAAGTFTGSPCTLVASTLGTATCQVTFTAGAGTGTANIVGTYNGDPAHSSSASAGFPVTIGLHVTITAVSCATPVVVNQGSTCTVTVTDTSSTGATTPTGVVSLSETGVTGSFTTCTLAGTTAIASCTSTFVASTSGTAGVTADYPGDTTHGGSQGTTSIVVNPRTTTTTISCTTPVLVNQGSTCAVTVTDTSPGTAIPPTGTLSLSKAGVTGSFTACTLAGATASATCSSTFTASTSGTAAVTANYPGDSTHSSSSGTTSIVVNPRTTSTTVSCATPVNVNQGSTCNITATDTSTAGTFLTPTGTVALSETGVTGSFTTCTLSGTTASATCTSTFTASTSGTAAVTASYPGDATHAASSGTASVTVNAVVGVPTVTVNSPTPNPANTGATVTVTFTVSSTATVNGITVDWGDGTTPDSLAGTAVSDSHVYTSTGNAMSKPFTITVTATNSAGSGSGTTTETVSDRPPVAFFTFTPASPSAGQTVNFDATTSTDPDGTITNYAWNFGDGTAGTGATTSHVYNPTTTTSFTVTLTVTDNSGSTTSSSQSVTVTVPVVNPPVVTINDIAPNPANTGQTVTVTFSVSSTAAVTEITVNWGDGTTNALAGTTTSDTHQYASTGNVMSKTFTVTVTATNSGGQGSATTTETVNDLPPVVTISTVAPNPANTGQSATISFTTTDSDGTVSSITVNWGDSSTPDTLGGTATSDTHTYTTAGTFTITVTATDNSGSTASATASETVTTATTTPDLLTFQAFNFTAFHNGFGSFEVLVNGHIVKIVNVPFVRSSTTPSDGSAPGANTFVNFGPIDITAFVIQGQNNVTFLNPTSSHFSLIRNITITQGSTVLLHIMGARFVSPGRPVTFTFSNPPLVITSFTVSDNAPSEAQNVTFTATYTGGTGPFKCIFLFGDEEVASTAGVSGSCSVTHDFDDSGTFSARVIVIGSSTSDRVSSSVKVTVVDSDLDALDVQLTTISLASSPDDD